MRGPKQTAVFSASDGEWLSGLVPGAPGEVEHVDKAAVIAINARQGPEHQNTAPFQLDRTVRLYITGPPHKIPGGRVRAARERKTTQTRLRGRRTARRKPA